MSLSQSVQQQQSSQYLDNVKKVGVELRQLLANVDFLMPAFPSSSHRQVRLGNWVTTFTLLIELSLPHLGRNGS